MIANSQKTGKKEIEITKKKFILGRIVRDLD